MVFCTPLSPYVDAMLLFNWINRNDFGVDPKRKADMTDNSRHFYSVCLSLKHISQ